MFELPLQIMSYEERFARRRMFSSYTMVVMSISLMLYVLGLLIAFVVNSNSLLNKLQENLGIQVIVDEFYSNDELNFDIKQLYMMPFTKQIVLTTNEEAAEELTAELGEDFIGFIGYNPLPTSFELKVNADYANPDSLALISQYLYQQKYVESVSDQEQMIRRLNDTRYNVGIVLLALVLLFMLIDVIIINNTVKLSIYSHRSVIKTMQTIGATTNFIRKPFISRSLFHGLLGATIAVIMLALTIYALINFYPDMEFILSVYEFVGVLIIIYIFGIMVAFFTALFAVNKYLDVRTKLLY